MLCDHPHCPFESGILGGEILETDSRDGRTDGVNTRWNWKNVVKFPKVFTPKCKHLAHWLLESSRRYWFLNLSSLEEEDLAPCLQHLDARWMHEQSSAHVSASSMLVRLVLGNVLKLGCCFGTTNIGCGTVGQGGRHLCGAVHGEGGGSGPMPITACSSIPSTTIEPCTCHYTWWFYRPFFF